MKAVVSAVCAAALTLTACRAIGAPDPDEFTESSTTTTQAKRPAAPPKPTTTKPPATTTTTVPNASVEGAIRLELLRPRREASVNGNAIPLEVALAGAPVGPAAADPATADPADKSLHFHVFIDRDPVPTGQPIPRNNPSVMHFAKNPPTIYGLAAGKHRLVVVLGDVADRRATRTMVESLVEVKGPAVTATAPRTVAPNQPIPVDLGYSGGTFGMHAGALHVEAVVAEDPPRPGEPVRGAVAKTAQARVDLPPLPPGTHKVWLVATDDKGVAAKPFAAAAITVRVASG